MWAQLGVSAIGLALASAVIGAQTARAFPPEQIARGEAVFNRVCAECHGPDSTDPDAPLLLRQDSLRRFPTAAAAHQYISKEMPSKEPGSLPAEEYWDVIAFLLAQSNLGAGDTVLGPETAAGFATRAGGTRGAPAVPKPGAEPAPAPPSPESAPPKDGEAPKDGDAPKGGEAPKDGQAPMEGEAPKEGEAPAAP